MSIDEAEISRIDAFFGALRGEVTPEVAEFALQRLLPGVDCRHCDASDVLEEPFRETEQVDLHLLDASSHCIRVTADPAEATAILLASKVTS